MRPARGLPLLRRRLDLCGEANRQSAGLAHGPLYHQRGECDPGCDISGCDGLDVAGDCLDGCDFFDFWQSRWRKRGKPLAASDSADLAARQARVDAARQQSGEEP